MPAREVNDEQKEVVKFLEKNEIRIFPYPFNDNYLADKIEVFSDAERGLKYVFQDGKRFYFKKGGTRTGSKKHIQILPVNT